MLDFIRSTGTPLMAPVRRILSEYAIDCTAGRCFSVLNDCVNAISNIDASCEFLTALLDRFGDETGGDTDFPSLAAAAEGGSQTAERILGELRTLCGTPAGAEFDPGKELGRVLEFKNHDIDAITNLVNHARDDLADALAAWDSFYAKGTPVSEIPGEWKRFYETVISLSPSREFYSSFFDRAGRYYGAMGGMRAQPNAYLYKVLYRRNITSCTCGHVVIHPNIPPLGKDWIEKLEKGNVLAMKISLVNNGIRFRGPPRNDIREGVNSSIDLMMDMGPFTADGTFMYLGRTYRQLPINCAYGNEIASLSPFSLSYGADTGKYSLHLYGRELRIGKAAVTFDASYRCFALEKDFSGKDAHAGGPDGDGALEKDFSGKDAHASVAVKVDVKGKANGALEPRTYERKTDNAVPYTAIGFIATDRIRFQHNCGCDFVKKGMGCQFCEMTIPGARQYSFGEADIEKVVNDSFADTPDSRRLSYRDRIGSIPQHPVEDKYFDHVLIGGGTVLDKKVMESRVLHMCRDILSHAPGMPIYLMSIPPTDHSSMDKYRDAGVTEVSFNMEVFDQVRASAYMPGKSRISQSEYISALRYAVTVWKKPGSVRSALIVGLEPEESTILGVRTLASLGVAPILSIFRPIRATRLGHIMPFPSDVLYEFYLKAVAICKGMKVEPGPTCMYCQNNVLALPRALLPPEEDE